MAAGLLDEVDCWPNFELFELDYLEFGEGASKNEPSDLEMDFLGLGEASVPKLGFGDEASVLKLGFGDEASVPRFGGL